MTMPFGEDFDLSNALQQMQQEQGQNAAPPGMKPLPGYPGYFYLPGTTYVVTVSTDEFGRQTLNEFPLSVGKALLGGAGISVGDDSSGGTRLASDDPRYWANLDRQFALDVQRLQAELMNMGLDADSARQQALTTLITNRNNTAVDVGQLSASVAKQIADFAANPRDAVAELMYRNQVGGSTPFGDLTNNNFGEYGKALAEKAASIFQPVAQDIQQARTYRDAIPPVEFFGTETRQQLGLPPTAAQGLAGGGTAVTAGPQTQAPAAANPLPALQEHLARLAASQAQQAQINEFAQKKLPKFDMGGVIKARTTIGDAPTSSEGGLNVNVYEPIMGVGMDSGKVYFTAAEPRPDGTRRGEQIIVKPLKSEVEKDRMMAEGHKAVTQSFGVPKMQTGGTVNATPDDFMEQIRTYLGNLGGPNGGTGAVTTPLQSPRLLPGAPWERLMDDPVAMDYALSGYSALGIDPRTIQSTVRKFTPNAPINNAPRVNWA